MFIEIQTPPLFSAGTERIFIPVISKSGAIDAKNSLPLKMLGRRAKGEGLRVDFGRRISDCIFWDFDEHSESSSTMVLTTFLPTGVMTF